MAKQAHDLGVRKRKLNLENNPVKLTREERLIKRMNQRRDRWLARSSTS